MDQTQPISLHIPLQLIRPNPEQPRTLFDPDKLNELADSIKEHGVLEPIIVEQFGDEYILHDGERRVMASRQAGRSDIPAQVYPPLNGTGPRTRLVNAMVLNVQRESMTPIEEARAYLRMRDEFGMNVTEIGRQIGRPYQTITQRLLLTELEPEIQTLIEQGLLPHFIDAVKAMLTIPAGTMRVNFCTKLASSKPTIKITVSACVKFLEHLRAQAVKKNDDKESLISPAVEIAQQHAALKLPAWNVWQQIGALPQWSVVRETATATCDACAIRAVASESNCKDCPLVECVRRMIQVSHAKPKPRK